MVKIGSRERGPVAEIKREVEPRAPKLETLGRLGELRKAKEHNVRDSVSSLHS